MCDVFSKEVALVSLLPYTQTHTLSQHSSGSQGSLLLLEIHGIRFIHLPTLPCQVRNCASLQAQKSAQLVSQEGSSSDHVL